MQKPISIKFHELDVDVASLRLDPPNKGAMPLEWTRVTFPVPDPWEAPQSVEKWLTENCAGRWRSYNYQNPKSKDSSRIMVVCFNDKNDALFFKLKGGHQAWEDND